jgi:lipid-binding SYLF domain-containing protein
MILFLRSVLLFSVLAFSCNHAAWAQFTSIFGGDKTVAQQRQDILKKNEEILNHLYRTQPKAKEVVQNAYGYATFSNFGMKILIAGGGSGTGVVMSKGLKKPVFMNMAEVQAGVGIGIKSFQNIFVFQNAAVLNNFIDSGWTFGGQATAAAKYEQDGASLQDSTVVADGVLMYQLTDSGLAAEITGKGTKYYKDSELNK